MIQKIKQFMLALLVMLSCSVGAVSAQNAADKTLKAQTAEDNAFLKKNKTAPGVKVTASGLQYKILKTGKGARPKKNNRIIMNYTIKDLRGKILFSNGNTPWNHKMDKAFYGMQEALLMMPVGSKWLLYMPDKLSKSGYENWPNSRATMCTIELLAIE